MKRGREEGEMAAVNIPECLMLLSKVGESDQSKRVFVCKTCNREFSSFQALGGHRASHKKPKLMGRNFLHRPVSQQKPKNQHECSICGLEFAVGQALGGHMRKHRTNVAGSEGLVTRSFLPPQVLKKCNSKGALCLDLNLMPSGDDLKLWVA